MSNSILNKARRAVLAQRPDPGQRPAPAYTAEEFHKMQERAYKRYPHYQGKTFRRPEYDVESELEDIEYDRRKAKRDLKRQHDLLQRAHYRQFGDIDPILKAGGRLPTTSGEFIMGGQSSPRVRYVAGDKGWKKTPLPEGMAPYDPGYPRRPLPGKLFQKERIGTGNHPNNR